MTQRQLLWIAALSVLATAIVLVGGITPPGLSAAAQAALGRSGEVAPVAPTPPGGAAADAPAATTVASTDDPRAATGDDVADGDSTPAAPSAVAPTADDTGDGFPEAAESEAGAGDDAAGDDGDDPDAPAASTPDPDAPRATNAKHVFVITLAGHGFDATFGEGSAAPYLAQTLRPKGTLLPNLTSLGAAGLPDRIAAVGGQPPNPSTQADCTTYREIPPATPPSTTGEITADGCVFPNSVVSLGDQLTSNRLTWQAYVEDHEKGPGGPATTCRRPVSNQADGTQVPRPGDAYAARNNPFVYFHSLLDLGGCDADVGPLTTLDADLASVVRTPNVAYIAPNLCHDGSASPCADGGPAGLAAADGFLQTWVPKILESPAYRADGVLIITFAGGPVPGLPSRNGALVLSRFARPGGTDDAALSPYSVLRSIEDLLGLRPLARAGTATSFAETTLGAARVAVAGDD